MARSDKVSEALRRVGNPYASLQIEGAEGGDNLADSQVAALKLHARSENPYSRHYYLADKASDADDYLKVAQLPEPIVDHKLSKSSFQQEARAIFRPYIPAAEGSRLRDHHREFIARNESRSAKIRYQLIAQLKRFDLRDLPKLRPLFNREDAVFTKEKLAEIERLVGADK